jgi:hypothetical protein
MNGQGLMAVLIALPGSPVGPVRGGTALRRDSED